MNIILFFSHNLNEDQVNDAKLNLKVDKFIKLDLNLQALFSNVSPEITNLNDFSKPFLEFLDKTAKKGDYALIQGDFGLCYILISYCFKIGVVPIYSTTRRDVRVDKDGIKVSAFKHVRFREYENFIFTKEEKWLKKL